MCHLPHRVCLSPMRDPLLGVQSREQAKSLSLPTSFCSLPRHVWWLCRTCGPNCHLPWNPQLRGRFRQVSSTCSHTESATEYESCARGSAFDYHSSLKPQPLVLLMFRRRHPLSGYPLPQIPGDPSSLTRRRISKTWNWHRVSNHLLYSSLHPNLDQPLPYPQPGKLTWSGSDC